VSDGLGDTAALLRLELETLWETDSDGRLLHTRTPVRRSPPLVVIATASDSLCWAVAADLDAVIAERIDDELEPRTELDADSRQRIHDIVATLGPVSGWLFGPSFVFAGWVHPPLNVEVWSSATHDADALESLMPEHDRALDEPWAAAMVEGRVAAVCETARSAPRSVEAGLWTYPSYRRRGLGSAITAAWSSLVEGRTAFYSTSSDNVASQGVARRLRLRPLGTWSQLHRLDPTAEQRRDAVRW
jgi:RimJ/RimL family protein N-acetyltransferase